MPSRSRSRSRSPSKRRRHRSPHSQHDRYHDDRSRSRYERSSDSTYRRSRTESSSSARRDRNDDSHRRIEDGREPTRIGTVSRVPDDGKSASPVSSKSESTVTSAEDDKIRQRRERVEQWRQQREAARMKDAGDDTNGAGDTAKAPLAFKGLGLKGRSVLTPGKRPASSLRIGFDGDEETTTSIPRPPTTIPTADASVAIASDGDQDVEVATDATAATDNETLEPMDEDEVDPLDAFMVGVSAQVSELAAQDSERLRASSKASAANGSKGAGQATPDSRLGQEDENEPEDEDATGSDPEDILAMAVKKAVKRKDVAKVDHSKMDYEPFRKEFYVEPSDLAEMTQEEVDLLRADLDGIKIRGVRPPKPVTRWTHCGFPASCYDVIKKLGYTSPTPIQAQGIPAILSGRDVIGIAKTGSGKTMAFLLPMFRHIKDQRPLKIMEGPIALIMTPTRELAVQIHRDCKPFLKALNLRAVCAYGGAPIKDQIADLKRGAEIIVCTPGRMIDLLCANAGRLTNLTRVTYLVLDEADRMFDMGFEPQVMKIVGNVRPGRQTVLFSATFPRQMEALARKVLRKPLEITVGGRSVVCDDVEQLVEVREEQSRFLRLLEILGQRYNENKDLQTLIFVDRQESADNLMRDLMKRGYISLSLHGGKDQMDRDSALADFKAGVVPILVATSVAARGLDVKMLGLVINYDCPNHMEDYVHRVGRTGRAGNKGTAYTFVTPEQDRFAADIARALKFSKVPVPETLQKMADDFVTKVRAGKAFKASSGFSGKGLERLDQERDLVKRIQKKSFGDTDGNESEDDEIAAEIEASFKMSDNIEMATSASTPTEGALAPNSPATPAETTSASNEVLDALKRAQQRAAMVNSALGTTSSADIMEKINSQFATLTEQKQQQQPTTAAASASARGKNPGGQTPYFFEIEINDYPRKARWQVTSKEEISRLTELTGAAITTRGTFYENGKVPANGERKLHLLVEAESQMSLEHAKSEIKRMLITATKAAIEGEARAGTSTIGRYSVV